MFSIGGSCSLLALGTAHASHVGSPAQHGVTQPGTARHAPPPRQALPALPPWHLRQPIPTSRGWERSRCWGSPRASPGSSPAPAFPRAGVRARSHHGTARPSPLAWLCHPTRSQHRAHTPHGAKPQLNPLHHPRARSFSPWQGLLQPPLPGHTAAAPSTPLHPCPALPWGARARRPVLGHSPNPAGAGVSPPQLGHRASPHCPSSHRRCSAPQRSRSCGQEDPGGHQPRHRPVPTPAIAALHPVQAPTFLAQAPSGRFSGTQHPAAPGNHQGRAVNPRPQHRPELPPKRGAPQRAPTLCPRSGACLCFHCRHTPGWWLKGFSYNNLQIPLLGSKLQTWAPS